MKKQGKVKTIPVSIYDLKEGMQLIVNYRITKVIKTQEKGLFILGIGLLSKVDTDYCEYDKKVIKNACKTLVVEYELSNGEKQEIVSNPSSLYMATPLAKQLPLKYSQWQSAIDNGEVDSDKVVDFEIIAKQELRPHYPIAENNQIAKIIPQKEKLYTREEVEDLIHAAIIEFNGNSLGLTKWLTENL